jgi:hypothetical protein
MRMVTADIVVRALDRMGLTYPEVPEKVRARFDEMRTLLEEG